MPIFGRARLVGEIIRSALAVPMSGASGLLVVTNGETLFAPGTFLPLVALTTKKNPLGKPSPRAFSRAPE